MSTVDGTGTVAAWGTQLVRWSADGTPDDADIKPGWVALVIVLLLCVVTTLLWLNMRKQLRKVRFEEKDTPRRGSGEPPAA